MSFGFEKGMVMYTFRVLDICAVVWISSWRMAVDDSEDEAKGWGACEGRASSDLNLRRADIIVSVSDLLESASILVFIAENSV